MSQVRRARATHPNPHAANTHTANTPHQNTSDKHPFFYLLHETPTTHSHTTPTRTPTHVRTNHPTPPIQHNNHRTTPTHTPPPPPPNTTPHTTRSQQTEQNRGVGEIYFLRPPIIDSTDVCERMSDARAQHNQTPHSKQHTQQTTHTTTPLTNTPFSTCCTRHPPHTHTPLQPTNTWTHKPPYPPTTQQPPHNTHTHTTTTKHHPTHNEGNRQNTNRGGGGRFTS